MHAFGRVLPHQMPAHGTVTTLATTLLDPPPPTHTPPQHTQHSHARTRDFLCCFSARNEPNAPSDGGYMETAGFEGSPGSYINVVDGDDGGYLLASSTDPASKQGTAKNAYDVDFAGGDDYDVDFGFGDSQGGYAHLPVESGGNVEAGYAHIPVAAERARLSAADVGAAAELGTGHAFHGPNAGTAKQNPGYDFSHPDAGAVV